jgi:hypothetical protein
VETGSVDQVVVGRVATVEAEASEGIEGAAGSTNVIAAAKVEVLSGRTGRVGNARTIDESVA